MCINSSLVIMLRAIINDLDSETYTDDRLEQLIAVAGMYVNKDLDGTYTIDIASPDITPDPFPDDIAFFNLLTMKAACLVDQGTFRTQAAMEGLEARCGPATMKVLGRLAGFKELLSVGPCGAYITMLRDYKAGDPTNYHGILSPFISNDFDPQTLRTDCVRGELE